MSRNSDDARRKHSPKRNESASEVTEPRSGPWLLHDWAPPTLDAFIARLVLVVLLLEIPGYSLFPISVLAAIVLIAMGALRLDTYTYKYQRWVLGLAVLAAVSGVLLRILSADYAVAFSSTREATLILVWLSSIPLVLTLAMWALQRVDFREGMVLISLGGLFSAVVNSDIVAWKGALGVYVTLTILAFVARSGLIFSQFFLLLAAIVSIYNDARSFAMICLTALLLCSIGTSLRAWMRRYPGRSSVLLVVLLAGIASVGLQAMMAGLFGNEIQKRTIAQLASGPNIILGARSEWAATLELLERSPAGYGLGVTPGSGDLSEALAQVAAVGGDYSNQFYWSEMVFGERVDVHSMLADLWIHFSLGGALFGLFLAFFLGAGIVFYLSVSSSQLGAAPILAILVAAWDLMFSPMGDVDRLIAGLVAAAAIMTFRHHRRGPFVEQAQFDERGDLEQKTAV